MKSRRKHSTSVHMQMYIFIWTVRPTTTTKTKTNDNSINNYVHGGDDDDEKASYYRIYASLCTAIRVDAPQAHLNRVSQWTLAKVFRAKITCSSLICSSGKVGLGEKMAKSFKLNESESCASTLINLYECVSECAFYSFVCM